MRKIITFSLMLLSIGTGLTAQENPTREELKILFRDGARPGGQDFALLIEACYNYQAGALLELQEGVLQALRQTDNNFTDELKEKLLALQVSEAVFTQLLKLKLDSLRYTEENFTRALRDSLLYLLSRPPEFTAAQRSHLDSLRYTEENFTRALREKLEELRYTEEDFTAAHRAKLEQLLYTQENFSTLLKEKLEGLNYTEENFTTAHRQKLEDLRYTDFNFTGDYREKLDSLRYTEENFTRDLRLKVDSLNYTEHNFSELWRDKLAGVEDGATRSDQNFTTAYRNKLENVEEGANRYVLPYGDREELGGLVLGNTLMVVDGKVEVALDPADIERVYAEEQFAPDPLWHHERMNADLWTRMRRIETDVNGDTVQVSAWSEPLRLHNESLEKQMITFFKSDSLNLLLGHRSDAKHEQLVSAVNNTVIGNGAGDLLTTGNDNVLLGMNAAGSTASLNRNVVMGARAGSNLSADDNVVLGYAAAQAGDHSQSVWIGSGAGAQVSSSGNSSNVAVGYGALSAGTGSRNVALGTQAGASAAGSDLQGNLFLGASAGRASLYASGNLFAGDSAGFSNEAGDDNIYIGRRSGWQNEGSGNLFLGSRSGDGQTAVSNTFLVESNGQKLMQGDFVSAEMQFAGDVVLPLGDVRLIDGNVSLSGGQVDAPVLQAGEELLVNGVRLADAARNMTVGHVTATGVVTAGSFSTAGALSAGSLSLTGDLEAQVLRVSDALHVGGSLLADASRNITAAAITGSGLTVSGTVQGSVVQAGERLEVGGNLLADTQRNISARDGSYTGTLAGGWLQTVSGLKLGATTLIDGNRDVWFRGGDFSASLTVDGTVQGNALVSQQGLTVNGMEVVSAGHVLQGSQVTAGAGSFSGTVTAPLVNVTTGLQVNGSTVVNGSRDVTVRNVSASAVNAATVNGDALAAQNSLSVGGAEVIDAQRDLQVRDAEVRDLNVTGTVTGFSGVPVGAIIMWSGDPADLPDGWALCDGNGNYADHRGVQRNIPDLRGRFVVSYGPDYPATGPGNGGGRTNSPTAWNVVLQKGNIPAHQHDARGENSTISIFNSGSHTHFTDAQKFGNDMLEEWGTMQETLMSPKTASIMSSEHDHPTEHFRGKIGDGSLNGLKASPDAVDIRPPYYVLAFIIKVN